MRLALPALVFIVGCSGGVHRLDPRWAPLVEVVERPSLILSDEASSTLGNRVYVADLDAWLRRYPDGSVEQEALLLHEQEHALRQQATGLGRWLGRYLNDRAFMWQEEQRGWALELRHLQRHGRPIVRVGIASALHGYRNLAGRMVGFAEALAWIDAVLNGLWMPPPEVPHG